MADIHSVLLMKGIVFRAGFIYDQIFIFSYRPGSFTEKLVLVTVAFPSRIMSGNDVAFR